MFDPKRQIGQFKSGKSLNKQRGGSQRCSDLRHTVFTFSVCPSLSVPPSLSSPPYLLPRCCLEQIKRLTARPAAKSKVDIRRGEVLSIACFKVMVVGDFLTPVHHQSYMPHLSPQILCIFVSRTRTLTLPSKPIHPLIHPLPPSPHTPSPHNSSLL